MNFDFDFDFDFIVDNWVVSFSHVTTSPAPGVQLFSCSFAVHIENCGAWWFSGSCSSLVVVEARSPRLNFLHKCTARFRILPHNIFN